MPQPAQATPRKIRSLPPLLVNQIAAGEVVERPASVVRELLDNAIDAGAGRITVELEGGGIELIRITDDGCGIEPEDLPLAVAPHATSKISVAEDLDRIGTMGFRGEALASIASVSRLSIRSRARARPDAALLEAEGDTVHPVRPAAGPVGTAVTVRNLFFNTPARRKFLRTAATEQGHCADAVQQLAISHPAIAFQTVCNGRTTLDLPPQQSARERVLAVLGRELESQLLEVQADHFDDARGMTMWGMAGLPSLARATNKSQHIYLNGRPIRDKTVQHALREAYRGLIEPGRHPTAVLMIEMDPGAVDVNVHPQKTEVRFRDSSMVHSIVLRAVRDALRAADLTPTVGAPHGGHFRAGEERAILPGPSPAVAGSAPQSQEARAAAFVEFFNRFSPAGGSQRLSYEALREAVAQTHAGGPDNGEAPAASAHGGVAPPAGQAEQHEGVGDGDGHGAGSGGGDGGEMGDSAVLETPRRHDSVLQVHNSFVVTQDDQGLLIVDQHALHERVMFEHLLARITAGELESQRMLVPPVLDVGSSQIARLGELRTLLGRIGVEAEAIGPTSVAVHAFPTFLFDRGVEPGPFLRELFEKSDEEGFAPESEATLHEVLDMMACKAAVKAGDRLSDVELRELLKLRESVERSSNCPHGRPTSIRLTIRELERRFGRS